MAVNLTSDSFLTLVQTSRLVAPEQLAELVDELDAQGLDHDDAAGLAEALVERGVLTTWQSRKLLQGKHRGLVLGAYRLLSMLGRGGMSTVYLAEHMMMARRCAIKVLPLEQVTEKTYLARFQREAQAVAALDHPNIVRAFDLKRTDCWILAM